jgi:hypothetical protein
MVTAGTMWHTHSQILLFLFIGLFVDMSAARVDVTSVRDDNIIKISELIRMWTDMMVIPISR